MPTEDDWDSADTEGYKLAERCMSPEFFGEDTLGCHYSNYYRPRSERRKCVSAKMYKTNSWRSDECQTDFSNRVRISESKLGIAKSAIIIIGKYLFCRLRSRWKA